MISVGVLARFEVKPGKEADMAHFFREGLTIVQQQPTTIAWIAFRLGPTTFGAFAVFPDEEARRSLLAVGGPVSSQRHAELFAVPPTFQLVDVIAAKIPG